MTFNPITALKSGVSFLTSNSYPASVPPHDVDRVKLLNHMESKKFYIVLTAVLILSFFYFTSVGILFLIPPNSSDFITGFTTIFSKTIEILSIIIATYVGAQAVVDLKYGSQSKVALETITRQDKIENITVIQTNAKEEDYELN
jgi:hypothetical protein